jgi:hypothetical protein
MGRSRSEAERALARLTLLLADLGLQPKVAKTRIVHLTVGGEGLTSSASTSAGTRRSTKSCERSTPSCVAGPGTSAMATRPARSTGSAPSPRAARPLPGQASQAPIRLGLAAGVLRVTRPTGLINSAGSSSHPGPSGAGGLQPNTAGDIGEPCAVEPHARFERRGLETERGHVTAPAPDPTTTASAQRLGNRPGAAVHPMDQEPSPWCAGSSTGYLVGMIRILRKKASGIKPWTVHDVRE